MYFVSIVVVILLFDYSLAVKTIPGLENPGQHTEPGGMDLSPLCVGNNCRRTEEGQFSNIIDLMKLIQSIVYVHEEQKKVSGGGSAPSPSGGAAGGKTGGGGGAAGGKPGGGGGAAGGKPGGGGGAAGGKPGGGGGAAGGKPGSGGAKG